MPKAKTTMRREMTEPARPTNLMKREAPDHNEPLRVIATGSTRSHHAGAWTRDKPHNGLDHVRSMHNKSEMQDSDYSRCAIT